MFDFGLNTTVPVLADRRPSMSRAWNKFNKRNGRCFIEFRDALLTRRPTLSNTTLRDAVPIHSKLSVGKSSSTRSRGS